MGYRALYSNTTGISNTATGYMSLYDNTIGSGNVADGIFALTNNTEGGYNTGCGNSALNNNTTGDYNTALGYYAYYSGNYTNSTALGSSASVSASNQVRIGNSSVTSIGGYASWTNLSDARFKEEVTENVPGLLFIEKLRPVTYKLDITGLNMFLEIPDSLYASDEMQQSVLAKEKLVQTGFIAQEVEEAARMIGFDFSGVDKPDNEKDHYGLRYAEFVVPLVKAVQELAKQNEEMRKQIETLNNKQ